MKINDILFVILLTLFVLPAYGQQKPNYIVIDSFNDLKEYFNYTSTKQVIISGHRGGIESGFPENSIESFENTLQSMPSFFEIDPQLTKDSILVLMHDKTLDRTTNFTGNLKDYTFKELQNARLKDKNGKITTFKIPTLEEALSWGKGKTIFNLDNKEVPWLSYVRLLKNNQYPHVALSVRSKKELEYYFKHLNEVMFVMPIPSQKELDIFESTNIPYDRLVAYVGPELKPELASMYSYLRAKGVMIFIATAPTADRIQSNQERSQAYIELLKQKPDIIETDYPKQFISN